MNPNRQLSFEGTQEGPPQQVPANLLSQDSAGLAFEGESVWDLLLLPEFATFTALCAALCTWNLLIGFFRALPAEFAWRRRYSALEELFSSLFEECAAMARKAQSGVKPLRRSAELRIDTHPAAPRANIPETHRPAEPASFPLPLFGVYSGNGKGNLWTETDAIE